LTWLTQASRASPRVSFFSLTKSKFLNHRVWEAPRKLDDILLILVAVWASVETWAWHRKMTRYLSEHEAKQRGLAR